MATELPKFEAWWEEEGKLGFRTHKQESEEMAVYKLCAIAWSNGMYIQNDIMNAHFTKILRGIDYTCIIRDGKLIYMATLEDPQMVTI